MCDRCTSCTWAALDNRIGFFFFKYRGFYSMQLIKVLNCISIRTTTSLKNGSAECIHGEPWEHHLGEVRPKKFKLNKFNKRQNDRSIFVWKKWKKGKVWKHRFGKLQRNWSCDINFNFIFATFSNMRQISISTILIFFF